MVEAWRKNLSLEKCPKINKRAGPNKIVQDGSWTKVK